MPARPKKYEFRDKFSPQGQKNLPSCPRCFAN